MATKTDSVVKYVLEHVESDSVSLEDNLYRVALQRFEKAFLLLPEEILDLFLTGARVLSVRIAPDASLPLGMATGSNGPPDARTYSIVVREEHFGWPADHFIGAFLRELGHVVERRPPETEWPQSRGERARYKEHLELRADAMVWRWGLRHYSMIHLAATYPEHWVTKIVEEIGRMLLVQDEMV
jgi:hypothetical protein